MTPLIVADNKGETALALLLGSGTRAKLLSYLLLPGAKPFYLREFARESGLHLSAVQREARLLEQLGIIESERVGQSKLYHVVEQTPIVPALRDLVRQAVGLVPLLRIALDRRDVEVAFIYGSVAAGADRPDSDVDLLIIGEVNEMELSEALASVAAQTGREITPVFYEPPEFAEGLQQGNSFLSSILRKPMIFVKGDEDALRQITG
jgi:DNA-binding transcriptional ArsR family regulator